MAINIDNDNLAVNEGYNDRTRLKNWWVTVKDNFAGVRDYVNAFAAAFRTHKGTKANGSALGHVTLSDSPDSGSGVSGGKAATPKSVYTEQEARKSADSSHAAVTASGSASGHVKLSDTVSAGDGIGSGKAATPKAVYAERQAREQAIQDVNELIEKRVPMISIDEEQDADKLEETGVYMLSEPKNTPFSSACALMVFHPDSGLALADLYTAQIAVFTDHPEVYVRFMREDNDTGTAWSYSWSEWAAVATEDIIEKCVPLAVENTLVDADTLTKRGVYALRGASNVPYENEACTVIVYCAPQNRGNKSPSVVQAVFFNDRAFEIYTRQYNGLTYDWGDWERLANLLDITDLDDKKLDKTAYASTAQAGSIKLHSRGNGTNISGLVVYEDGTAVVNTSDKKGTTRDGAGQISIVAASNEEIAQKAHEYKPIVPKTLDYAVEQSAAVKNLIDRITDMDARLVSLETSYVEVSASLSADIREGILNITTAEATGTNENVYYRLVIADRSEAQRIDEEGAGGMFTVKINGTKLTDDNATEIVGSQIPGLINKLADGNAYIVYSKTKNCYVTAEA